MLNQSGQSRFCDGETIGELLANLIDGFLASLDSGGVGGELLAKATLEVVLRLNL